MVSNDLLVSMRSLHPSQCVLLKLAIREIISSIKLTESMVLAVDGILHLYTGLCGAMLWSCLLNTGAIFTWRQFLHLAKLRCAHHCTQVPVIFKVWWSHWEYDWQWSGLRKIRDTSEPDLFQMLRCFVSQLSLFLLSRISKPCIGWTCIVFGYDIPIRLCFSLKYLENMQAQVRADAFCMYCFVFYLFGNWPTPQSFGLC